MSEYPMVRKLFGINGDGWSTPASTLNACWSALGAGASGLALTMFGTRDGVVVCAPANDLRDYCDQAVAVSALTVAELRLLDAGYRFRSTELDAQGQPTGKRGEDTPWRARGADDTGLKARAAVYFPELREVLELFGRRTEIILMLPASHRDVTESLIDELLSLLSRFGLLERVILCGEAVQLQAIHDRHARARLLLDMRSNESSYSAIESISPMGVLMNVEQLGHTPKLQVHNHLSLYLASATMPYVPSPTALAILRQLDGHVAGYLSHSVLPCADLLRGRALVFHEDFAGAAFNTRYWSAGYSHINTETSIYIRDGLHIDICQGQTYSGAAAILTLPIEGDFDAQVTFEVSHPHQATTFEMAAIGIDPGYHHPDLSKPLNTRTVNLTFDVHGAPPYASSERDQDDGFRCGWNNSFNFAKFGDPHGTEKDADWIASSANMYNKYGRDVGNGGSDNPRGRLRLVRSGAVFNSYYRDQPNHEWVCSGSMLVSTLPPNAFVRLAAKHWGKLKEDVPANAVTFSDFSLYQY